MEKGVIANGAYPADDITEPRVEVTGVAHHKRNPLPSGMPQAGKGSGGGGKVGMNDVHVIL